MKIRIMDMEKGRDNIHKRYMFQEKDYFILWANIFLNNWMKERVKWTVYMFLIAITIALVFINAIHISMIVFIIWDTKGISGNQ